MNEPQENSINKKAKMLAQVLVVINIFIYLILFACWFLMNDTPEFIKESSESLIYFAYSSCILSIIIVFKTTHANKKTELGLQYFVLFIINATVALFHFGFNHMFDGATFG